MSSLNPLGRLTFSQGASNSTSRAKTTTSNRSTTPNSQRSNRTNHTPTSASSTNTSQSSQSLPHVPRLQFTISTPVLPVSSSSESALINTHASKERDPLSNSRIVVRQIRKGSLPEECLSPRAKETSTPSSERSSSSVSISDAPVRNARSGSLVLDSTLHKKPSPKEEPTFPFNFIQIALTERTVNLISDELERELEKSTAHYCCIETLQLKIKGYCKKKLDEKLENCADMLASSNPSIFFKWIDATAHALFQEIISSVELIDPYLQNLFYFEKALERPEGSNKKETNRLLSFEEALKSYEDFNSEDTSPRNEATPRTKDQQLRIQQYKDELKEGLRQWRTGCEAYRSVSRGHGSTLTVLQAFIHSFEQMVRKTKHKKLFLKLFDREPEQGEKIYELLSSWLRFKEKAHTIRTWIFEKISANSQKFLLVPSPFYWYESEEAIRKHDQISYEQLQRNCPTQTKQTVQVNSVAITSTQPQIYFAELLKAFNIHHDQSMWKEELHLGLDTAQLNLLKTKTANIYKFLANWKNSIATLEDFKKTLPEPLKAIEIAIIRNVFKKLDGGKQLTNLLISLNFTLSFLDQMESKEKQHVILSSPLNSLSPWPVSERKHVDSDELIAKLDFQTILSEIQSNKSKLKLKAEDQARGILDQKQQEALISKIFALCEFIKSPNSIDPTLKELRKLYELTKIRPLTATEYGQVREGIKKLDSYDEIVPAQQAYILTTAFNPNLTHEECYILIISHLQRLLALYAINSQQKEEMFQSIKELLEWNWKDAPRLLNYLDEGFKHSKNSPEEKEKAQKIVRDLLALPAILQPLETIVTNDFVAELVNFCMCKKKKDKTITLTSFQPNKLVESSLLMGLIEQSPAFLEIKEKKKKRVKNEIEKIIDPYSLRHIQEKVKKFFKLPLHNGLPLIRKLLEPYFSTRAISDSCEELSQSIQSMLKSLSPPEFATNFTKTEWEYQQSQFLSLLTNLLSGKPVPKEVKEDYLKSLNGMTGSAIHLKKGNVLKQLKWTDSIEQEVVELIHLGAIDCTLSEIYNCWKETDIEKRLKLQILFLKFLETVSHKEKIVRHLKALYTSSNNFSLFNLLRKFRATSHKTESELPEAISAFIHTLREELSQQIEVQKDKTTLSTQIKFLISSEGEFDKNESSNSEQPKPSDAQFSLQVFLNTINNLDSRRIVDQSPEVFLEKVIEMIKLQKQINQKCLELGKENLMLHMIDGELKQLTFTKGRLLRELEKWYSDHAIPCLDDARLLTVENRNNTLNILMRAMPALFTKRPYSTLINKESIHSKIIPSKPLGKTNQQPAISQNPLPKIVSSCSYTVLNVKDSYEVCQIEVSWVNGMTALPKGGKTPVGQLKIDSVTFNPHAKSEDIISIITFLEEAYSMSKKVYSLRNDLSEVIAGLSTQSSSETLLSRKSSLTALT